MGMPVLIIGQSGSGKTTSLRNFNENEIGLVNVESKPLPFKKNFKNTLDSDNYKNISQFIVKCPCNTIVIDDSQYLMANEFMRRASEKGFQKFTDIGSSFWNLIRMVSDLPKDKIVYFLQHSEIDENGNLKAKTIGKLLDEKISLEGMFTIVLRTLIMDNTHYFTTSSDGRDTVKAPMEMFSKSLIDNDLKQVDNIIRNYYNMKSITDTDENNKFICSVCGKYIIPQNGRTIEEIKEGTIKNFGKQMCFNCMMQEIKQRKKQNA